eukprot:c43040_g1_i1 orf=49-198(-)
MPSYPLANPVEQCKCLSLKFLQSQCQLWYPFYQSRHFLSFLGDNFIFSF